MKLTPSSTARRKTFFAFSRPGGQPQIPPPVAPKPSRLTKRSPPNRNVESLASGIAAGSPINLRSERQPHLRKSPPKTFFVSLHGKYVAPVDSQLSLVGGSLFLFFLDHTTSDLLLAVRGQSAAGADIKACHRPVRRRA